MTSDSGSKINQLMKAWPQGAVAVSPWLEKQGAYQQLVREYEKTSWVRRIGQGAFVRAGDKFEWHGGLFAIQDQLGLPIHAGGKTALQLLGYAHFLPLGKGYILSLFGEPGVKLPRWFLKYPWDVKPRYTTTKLFPRKSDLGLTKKEMGNYSITLSSPERAIMEVLHLVPHKESYEEAQLLMEAMTTLRPQLVQKLLETCRSVKVKRLFMILAEGCNHRWVQKLDLSKVDLGRGKRLIAKGGHFNSKYGVALPGPRPVEYKPGEGP
ncbi:MAG TPA: type IV toxin-antitoxin system AbiEi family antitoxin domain-containing protein [bacterium]|nr:type IV toxin-antitoxin system AbiEi family antitoxin domain-containing protein [bacterium]